MRKFIHVWSFVLLAFCTAKLHAYRVEFFTLLEGERVRGSEICLYRGTAGSGPAGIYFASNQVRCLPADQIIDLPAGTWSFYARHPDGYISAHGSAISWRGPRNPDHGYRAINVDLHPVAYVTFDHAPTTSDTFAAYVPMRESTRYAPATFPLPAGERRIAIPAAREFVLLRVRGGKPVGAGPLTKVAAGATLAALDALPDPKARDLIGWLKIDEASFYEVANVRAPVVRLVDAAGVEHQPLFDWHSAGAADEGLVIFRDPPASSGLLRVGGPDWRTTDHRIAPLTEGGTFLDEPLVARLPQRLLVRWHVPAAARASAACDGTTPAAATEEWSVVLLSCRAISILAAEHTDNCREVDTRRLPAVGDTGVVPFDVRAPGPYAVRIDAPDARIASKPVFVSAKQDASLDVDVSLPRVFGSITEGGRPLRALLRFETGSAVSDASGSYVAVLRADALDNVIEVVPCDGTDAFQHIPDEPIVGTRQYDIRIPENRVEVLVRDAATRKPIPHAAVGRGIFGTAEDARAKTTQGDMQADKDGAAVLRRLEPGYFVRVCAAAAGYSPPVCAEPIKLESDTTANVTLDLHRRELEQGRLVSDRPLRGTTAYRTLASGVVVEESNLQHDGSFTFTGESAAPFIVFAGADHPLIVVPHPPIARGEILEVRVPTGRTRNFTVEIGAMMPQRSGWFTVAIGDAVVPTRALTAHLTRRGLISYVENGGPARVVDILESAPLRVLAIVATYPEPPSVADLFILPEYAAIRQFRPVPLDGRVVFDRSSETPQRP